jgi:hypothetical protein
VGFLTGEFISLMLYGCFVSLSEYFPHSLSLVCAPGARAPSSFVRTLDSGATVRSPNCDLRGSSVTCASHGGTAKRLARMLQRSLDPARNGFLRG